MDKTGVNLLYIKKKTTTTTTYNNKFKLLSHPQIVYELIETGIAKDIFTNTRFIYRWTIKKSKDTTTQYIE